MYYDNCTIIEKMSNYQELDENKPIVVVHRTSRRSDNVCISTVIMVCCFTILFAIALFFMIPYFISLSPNYKEGKAPCEAYVLLNSLQCNYGNGLLEVIVWIVLIFASILIAIILAQSRVVW